MITGATWYCCENPTAATDPTEKQFLRLLWFLKWPEPQWCYQDVAEGGSVEVKQWDVLSEPDVKASRLLSRASSLWKWLRDVWWAEEETPFTTALLSLWEFIIHTDWPHTWAHTHTHSHSYACNIHCGRLLHTCSLRCEPCGADVYTIHHIINMILWASPAPPMQADSPAEFHPQGQRLWDKGVNVEAVIVKP